MKASILEDFFRSETAVGFFVEKVNGDTLDSAKIFVKKKKEFSSKITIYRRFQGLNLESISCRLDLLLFRLAFF